VYICIYIYKEYILKEDKNIFVFTKKENSSKIKDPESWSQSELAYIFKRAENIWNDPSSVMHKEKEKSHEMLVVWLVAKKSCVKYHTCVIIYIESDRIRMQM
jgi:hypothetical protein